MKKIYLIRSAKAEDFSTGLSDFERSVRKKGVQDIHTIGSYLSLRGISPDIMLSSCALRAEETALKLEKLLDFQGVKYFLEELYFKPHQEIYNIITAQDDTYSSMFVIGHNPQLNELVNALSKESVNKIASMGVVALTFDVESWSELEHCKGDIEFNIYPKQFKYYMPQQIQAILPR